MQEKGACEVLAEAYAFIGNSLLKPMSQTKEVGLEPAFWEAFPCFGDERVEKAVRALHEHAFATAHVSERVQEVSVEFTKLFVGPPHPAAPPWESYYAKEGVSSGFGEPTFQMQGLLREHGLALSGDSNQFADHMGIELLLLSELVRRASGDGTLEEADAFARSHPRVWLGKLRARVDAAFPGCYIAGLLALADALLRMQLGE